MGHTNVQFAVVYLAAVLLAVVITHADADDVILQKRVILASLGLVKAYILSLV